MEARTTLLVPLLLLFAAPAVIATSTMLIAVAQPVGGSSYTYTVIVESNVRGRVAGLAFNSTSVCTYNMTVLVLNVSRGFITVLVKASKPRCNFTGAPAPYSLGIASIAWQYTMGEILKVPVNARFDPLKTPLYVDPSMLPEGGAYKGFLTGNGTIVSYSYEYDEGSGMLRSARLASTGPAGPGFTLRQVVNVRLTSSSVAGSYGEGGLRAAGWAERGTIAALAAAALLIAYKVGRQGFPGIG